jgi:DNA-binding transcriptional MerR regulator
MALTVSQVAKLAGVTVRTLHHYDEVGLVRPSERSEAGYRLYEDRDLERLQQVLFFRELGFPLEEIARIVNDPSFDVRAALRMQRELLRERAERAQALLRAVEQALEALERGKAMTKEEMFEVFGDFDVDKHDLEARERWGNTEAYQESSRRTARYGKQEWQRIKEEGDRIQQQLAELMQSGHAANDPEVIDAAEAHRQYIERWFYPCSRAMHRGLGELYVQDPRFTASMDRQHSGLAEFMRNAFRANAERAS